MILAIDVHYSSEGSTTAGIAFENWSDSTPSQTYLSELSTVNEYKPGQFYERELPCILNLLNQFTLSPRYILVDGYVFLDGKNRAGLGKHLFDALDGKVPVIGVAKTAFAGIGPEFQIVRGSSEKPLFVTCAGFDLVCAKTRIQEMHGSHRIPTLLKAVDHLCRQKSL